ncbi:hypothetical protein DUNSADRAFT_13185 [Dunaliella salina]|uniref:Uncharacterized protein n=1 Tax=Dunaliella salina TaxID=3046 RepID=A0ABQ7G9W5_DUNSA|nr:hypothetical protein DUNSADRAFT_13185 [Dunaliella salina]|eukprot:KAF5831395.1 hypothetical protein DUNSADRAFT_13185 [Dunaliella salina]
MPPPACRPAPPLTGGGGGGGDGAQNEVTPFILAPVSPSSQAWRPQPEAGDGERKTRTSGASVRPAPPPIVLAELSALYSSSLPTSLRTSLPTQMPPTIPDNVQQSLLPEPQHPVESEPLPVAPPALRPHSRDQPACSNPQPSGPAAPAAPPLATKNSSSSSGGSNTREPATLPTPAAGDVLPGAASPDGHPPSAPSASLAGAPPSLVDTTARDAEGGERAVGSRRTSSLAASGSRSRTGTPVPPLDFSALRAHRTGSPTQKHSTPPAHPSESQSSTAAAAVADERGPGHGELQQQQHRRKQQQQQQQQQEAPTARDLESVPEPGWRGTRPGVAPGMWRAPRSDDGGQQQQQQAGQYAEQPTKDSANSMEGRERGSPKRLRSNPQQQQQQQEQLRPGSSALRALAPQPSHGSVNSLRAFSPEIVGDAEMRQLAPPAPLRTSTPHHSTSNGNSSSSTGDGTGNPLAHSSDTALHEVSRLVGEPGGSRPGSQGTFAKAQRRGESSHRMQAPKTTSRVNEDELDPPPPPSFGTPAAAPPDQQHQHQHQQHRVVPSAQQPEPEGTALLGSVHRGSLVLQPSGDEPPSSSSSPTANPAATMSPGRPVATPRGGRRRTSLDARRLQDQPLPPSSRGARPRIAGPTTGDGGFAMNRTIATPRGGRPRTSLDARPLQDQPLPPSLRRARPRSAGPTTWDVDSLIQEMRREANPSAARSLGCPVATPKSVQPRTSLDERRGSVPVAASIFARGAVADCQAHRGTWTA